MTDTVIADTQPNGTENLCLDCAKKTIESWGTVPDSVKGFLLAGLLIQLHYLQAKGVEPRLCKDCNQVRVLIVEHTNE